MICSGSWAKGTMDGEKPPLSQVEELRKAAEICRVWNQSDSNVAMCVLLNVIRSLARDIPKVLHFLINLNRTQTLNISKYRRYCCNRLKHWPHSARILSTESLPPLACTGHWALQAEATWSSGAGVDPFAQMIQWYDVLHGSGSET